MVAWFVGQLFGWSVGWLVAWLIGWLVAWLARWLFGCLVGCLVAWLVSWLVGCYQIHLTDNYVRHLPNSDTRSYTLIIVHIKHANIKPMRHPQPQHQPPTTTANKWTKVEGEAVGNLDSLLKWKTIHVGTYKQRCRSKVCRVGEVVVDPAPDLSVGREEGGVEYVSTHHIPPGPTSIKQSDKCSE